MNFNYIHVPGNHFKPLRGEKWTRHLEKEKCSPRFVAFSLCYGSIRTEKKSDSSLLSPSPSTHRALQRLLNQNSSFYMKCYSNINRVSKEYGTVEVVVSASPGSFFVLSTVLSNLHSFSQVLRTQVVSQISPILQTHCSTEQCKLLAQRCSKWQS